MRIASKKKLGILAVITALLLVIIFRFSSLSYAYPGGLADGKTATLSASLWGEGETTLLTTDNDKETGVTLNNQNLTIDLGDSYTIKSRILNASGSLRWNMYDSSKNYITGFNTTSYPMDGSLYVSTIQNVRYLVISGTGSVNEVDVFTSADLPPTPSVDPTPSPTPQAESRAILTITMTTGLEKEFDLSMDEVNSFISWYEAKEASTGPASYAIDKHENNKGPFISRKDYVIFKNILSFEVNEYAAKD